VAGSPNAFPQPIYVLRLAEGNRFDLFTFSPQVQRYYAFQMAPFDPPFYPQAGTAVFIVSLHEVRGFDFMGNIHIKEPKLTERCVVRYTYTLEAVK